MAEYEHFEDRIGYLAERDRRCSNFTTFVLSFLPPLLLIIVAQMADTYIDPYQRNVTDYKNGPSISFPVKPSIVTDTDLVIVSWVIPSLVILTVSWLKKSKTKRSITVFLAFCETAAATFLFVVVGKKVAGSLRPCFIGIPAPAPAPYPPVSLDLTSCSYVPVGWRQVSFDPSGNSRFETILPIRTCFLERFVEIILHSEDDVSAAAGLVFLSQFLHCEFHSMSSTAALSSLFRLMVLAPPLVAFLIGIARTITYHHRFEDIIMGFVLGGSAAIYMWRSHGLSNKSPSNRD
ncbi:hypothetical protein GUITHDRAFT_161414, partial [Guillardia theta CCMP2712]